MKNEISKSHSSDTNWGYEILANEKIDIALKIFELNTLLFPEAPNVWDSYGEILLVVGAKEKAIEMYQKSLDLNPENEHAKLVLEELLNDK